MEIQCIANCKGIIRPILNWIIYQFLRYANTVSIWILNIYIKVEFVKYLLWSMYKYNLRHWKIIVNGNSIQTDFMNNHSIIHLCMFWYSTCITPLEYNAIYRHPVFLYIARYVITRFIHHDKVYWLYQVSVSYIYISWEIISTK